MIDKIELLIRVINKKGYCNEICNECYYYNAYKPNSFLRDAACNLIFTNKPIYMVDGAKERYENAVEELRKYDKEKLMEILL